MAMHKGGVQGNRVVRYRARCCLGCVWRMPRRGAEYSLETGFVELCDGVPHGALTVSAQFSPRSDNQ
jgi:hypothetical protein